MINNLKIRWHVAIHESAHLVVGLMLTADENSRAGAIITGHNGDGQAPLPTLCRYDFLITTAAGSIATELLENSPVPQLPERVTADISSLCVFPKKPLPDREPIEEPEVDSDEVVIALACIEGCQKRPWEWVRNYTNYTSEARRLVCENREAILKVASKVFCAGYWIGNRKTLELFLENQTTHPAAVPGICVNHSAAIGE